MEYLIYEPRTGQWLDEAAEWTPTFAEARRFPTYEAAMTVREVIEKEAAYGTHGLMIAPVHERNLKP
jgi:hypothetical protein